MSSIPIQNASTEDANYVDHQIIHFNNTMVPFQQEPPFLSINRCMKEGNELIAGILAQVYCWNILYIDVLWVKADHRNKGYATALVNDVEKKAREMNCRICHLDTFDFQAKGLYEKLGYSVFGILEDCPEGHSRYYMSKSLCELIVSS